MVQSFISRLMLTEDADEYWAKFIAFNIDRELHLLCPDHNAYSAKARSLISNLKSNTVSNIFLQYLRFQNILYALFRNQH